MTSIELSQYVGGELHEAYPNLKVDVHHPELTVYRGGAGLRRLRPRRPEPGAGGLPVGINGRARVPALRRHRLPGGRLDDRQAGAWPWTWSTSSAIPTPPLRPRRRCWSWPSCSPPGTGRLTVHVVPFTAIQEELRRNCPEELFTVIMRRFMMRIAQEVAERHRAQAPGHRRVPGPGGQPDHGGHGGHQRGVSTCPSSARWWGWTRRRSSRSPGRSAPSRPPSCPTRIAARCSRPAIPKTPSHGGGAAGGGAELRLRGSVPKGV